MNEYQYACTWPQWGGCFVLSPFFFLMEWNTALLRFSRKKVLIQVMPSGWCKSYFLASWSASGQQHKTRNKSEFHSSQISSWWLSTTFLTYFVILLFFDCLFFYAMQLCLCSVFALIGTLIFFFFWYTECYSWWYQTRQSLGYQCRQCEDWGFQC